MSRLPRVKSVGFTIIEILVSTMLLAMVLVAIFGAQFAAVKSAVYAGNVTQATELARCKMSELELLFIEEGFQEGDSVESGPCCEFVDGEETKTAFGCEWSVEMVEFPDMQEMMNAEDLSDDTLEDLGLGAGSTLGGEDMMNEMASEEMADMGLGVMGEIMPVITDLLEIAIRRVTVTVIWKEGTLKKDFEIVQYVTNPSEGPLEAMQESKQINDQM